MINRSKKLDISNSAAAKQFDAIDDNDHDKQLLKKLVKEVNEMSYHIQYYWQLEKMELCDDFIFPIIKDYIGKFENQWYSVQLITYLGIEGLYRATEFLIDLYRNDDLREDDDTSIQTIRWACGKALLEIKDSNYIEEYHQLIKMKGTGDGRWMLIQLLGSFETEDNFELLLSYLNQPTVTERNSAVKALGYYSYHACVLKPVLEYVIAHDEADLVRETAKRSLIYLQRYGKKYYGKYNFT